MEKYSKFNRAQFLYVILLMLCVALMVIQKHYLVAAIVFIASMVVFFFINSVFIFKKKSWDRFVEDSLRKLKSNVIDVAKTIEFPLVIFTRDGIVSWYNDAFKEAINKEEIIEVDEILDLNINKIWSGEYPDFIEIGEKIYKPAFIKYNAAEDEFAEDVIVLELTDITALKKSEDSKTVFMLIEVDNMSEVYNSTPEDRRPFIGAEIEKEIFSYAGAVKGFMKKYATNKYFIVAPYEVIRDEEKKKFPILEQIKNIDFGNTIEPTISMGLAYDNGSVELDSDAATSAKELALGRGGDQVVVKRGENLTFYGGNSRELEKKSRVRARVIAHALRDLMIESDHIYIMGHNNPDMDCLGAAVGIRAITRAIGKESNIIMDKSHANVQDLMNLLSKDKEYEDAFIESSEVELQPKDLIIVVDVHSQGYVLNKDIANSKVRKVVIDHHRRTQDAIQNVTLNFIETYASSTSELVTELIQYIVDKPDLLKSEANALLAGIWVDTKGFYFKTGVRTFEAASFLRRSGASTNEIRGMFAYDKDNYLKKADIIRNAKVENSIAVAKCPEGMDDPLIAAQAADELLNIKGIHTSFVLFQKNNDVIISARSLGDVNVQVIMEKFGGGGHMTMAGTRVNEESMDEVEKKLIEVIREETREEDTDESDTSTGR